MTMCYNEIYCSDKYTEAVSDAIKKLSAEHPEWELSDGDWAEVETHPTPWTVKRHELESQPEMEAVVVEDLMGETLITLTVLKGSVDDETALALAEDALEDDD